MKKQTIYLLILGIVGLTFVSCAHEEIDDAEYSALKENQFEASFSDKETKVTMDSDYNLSWEKGDKVSVFDESGNNLLFTAAETAANTILEGNVEVDASKTYYAVCPYSESNTIDGASVSLSISPVQTPRAGSFPTNYSVAMSEGRSFRFYNVCGLVGFEITEEDIASVIVTPNKDGECLTGKIAVDCSDIASPSYEVEDGISEVTLMAENVFEKGYHYVAVLPQTFEEGITVTMYKKDGTQAKKTTTIGFTLNRSHHIDTKQIDADQDWTDVVLVTSAGDLIGFLATADALPATAEVRLLGDIDLKGYEITPAKSFAGTVEGNSNSILNWNTKTALFETLASTAVVKELVIDSSCSLEVQETGDAAFITLVNEGLISGCINYGAVTSVEKTFTSTGERRVGTMAAVSTGSIVSCVNDGAVTLAPASINMAATQFVGGIAGQASASAGQNAMEGCINNGNVSVTPTGFSCRLFVGGVCGGTPAAAALTDGFTFGDYGLFTSCRNTGKVTLTNSGTSKKTTYINVGGVIGYAEASLSDCDNEGAVTVTLKTSASEVKHTFQRPAVGGVAGTVLYNVDGCDNTGALNVKGIFGESNPEVYASDSDRDMTGVGVGQFRQAAFGGVVAVAGNGAGSTLNNCTNAAAMTLDLYAHKDALAQAFAGGVAGYADAAVSGCSYSGKSGLDVKNRMHCGHVGGVVGMTSQTVMTCTNSAPVSYDSVNDSASGNCSAYAHVGGVAGYLSYAEAGNVMNYSGNTAAVTVSGGYCSEDYVTCVGGLVGRSATGRILGSDSTGSKKEIKGVLTVNTPSKVYAGGIVGAMGLEGTASKGFYAFARQSDIKVTKPGRGSRIGGVCGYRLAGQNDAGVNVQSKITVDCESGNDIYVGQYYGEYNSGSTSYQIHSSTINSPDFSAPGATACGVAAGLLYSGKLELGKTDAPFTVRPNMFNDKYLSPDVHGDDLSAMLVGVNRGTLKETNVIVLGQYLAEWTQGYLDIHFINTGTGECSFIIMPDGTQMLVDVASADTKAVDTQDIDGVERNIFIPRVPDDSKRPSEWINMYLAKCMAWTGNNKLDYISITHFDGDHIGERTQDNRVDGLGGSATPSGLDAGGYQKIGLAEILDDNNVGVLVDRAYPSYDYPVTEDLVNNNKMKNYRNAAAWHVTNRGMVHEAFVPGADNQFVMKYAPASYPDFEIRNVASNGYMWTGSGTSVNKTFPDNSSYVSGVAASMPNENMNSTAFRLSYGLFDYFAGGDLECDEHILYTWRNTEKPVADAVGGVEVMKANHHGSEGDNSQYFLDKLAPQAIIVNTWRSVQPRTSTYERFRNSGADIFTTNLDSGYAGEYSDGGASIDSTHGHYVVRVAPGGDYYCIYVLDDKDKEMKMKLLKHFGPYKSR